MKAFLALALFCLMTVNAPAQQYPLSKQDVLDLAHGGVSPQRIVRLIDERGVDFDPTSAVTSELRAAGLDESVLAALRKAAAALHVRVGDQFAEQKEFAQAERKYRAALGFQPESAEADRGIASALRQQYVAGKPPAEDLDAVLFYREAAERGRPWAQTEMGILYESGTAIAKDATQAATFYRKAADQGEAWAQFRLGVMSQGNGLAHDDLAAALYLRKAADQSLAEAQLELALLYRDGRGVSRDAVAAKSWLRKAADQGNVRAGQLISQLDASASSATLYGTVYDPAGKPLAGVIVTLTRDPAGLSQTQTTDADGSYSFMGVPPGEGYRLSASANGFVLDQRAGLTLRAGEETLVMAPLRQVAALAGAELLPPRQPLQLTATASFQYWTGDDAVHLQFTVAEDESPAVDVDVDHNGRIDPNADVAFGLSSGDRFCPQYILDQQTYSTCGGLLSRGKVSAAAGRGKSKIITFVLPKQELSTDHTSAVLVFRICRLYNGQWQCMQYPLFRDPKAPVGQVFSSFARTVQIALQ